MKVLMINGSPRKNGCTHRALSEIASVLGNEGIETEIFNVPSTVAGCMSCGGCKAGRCVKNDCVNEVYEKCMTADGFVFGSPVYFASASGSMISFMDRLFYISGKEIFRGKPAASIASARRAGTTATVDELDKYIKIAGMINVPSIYWNMVHGSTPSQVEEDIEGLQIMRELGKSMAYLIKLIKLGNEHGVTLPPLEKSVYTNFVR